MFNLDTHKSKVSKKLSSRSDENLSVLVIHSVLKPGGASRVAIDDAIGLRQHGWRVGFAAQPGAWSGELSRTDIRFHRLFFLHSGKYPTWFRLLVGLPLDTFLLLFSVLRWRYQYLYLHHRQLSIPCEIVARITGIRYIFMAHVEFTGKHAGTHLGGNILAVSEKVKSNLLIQFGISPENVYVLPNAVRIRKKSLDDISETELRRKWDILSCSPVVACVALLNEQKAHNVLLDAWADVAKRFPSAILLLAGDGPLRSSLETQAARLDIATKVRFLGLVGDIENVYALSQLVVLSSAWEGMPLTLLEAAAYGLSAVATCVSGTPEIVSHEQTGLLVEPGDSKSLSQAIIRLLENEPLRREMGVRAAEASLKRSSHTQRLSELIDYLTTRTT